MIEEDESNKVEAAYQKGVLDQRLAGYDIHFSAINGSVERTASELNKLRVLFEEQLSGKTDRARFHELLAEVGTINLKLTTFEQTVVKREGPIVDRIDRNMERIEKLEANVPLGILQMKEELIEGLQALREEVIKTQFAGSFRRIAAAASAFAVTIGVMLAVVDKLGVI